MAKKKAINDYGAGIPQHQMEALARVLLPEIEKFYASEIRYNNFRKIKKRRHGLQVSGRMKLRHTF